MPKTKQWSLNRNSHNGGKPVIGRRIANMMHSRLRTLAFAWMKENRPGVIESFRERVRKEFAELIRGEEERNLNEN